MKAIVEWGKPKTATERGICGISGQFVVESATKAVTLARQLYHTMTEGKGYKKDDWLVTREMPRKTVWTEDNSGWICVSLLDGEDRGSYAALADKEAKRRIKSDTRLPID